MLCGRSVISTLPLCQHWSDEDIKARVIVEKKVGYGESFLDSSYPISKARHGRRLVTFYPWRMMVLCIILFLIGYPRMLRLNSLLQM